MKVSNNQRSSLKVLETGSRDIQTRNVYGKEKNVELEDVVLAVAALTVAAMDAARQSIVPATS